MAQFCKTEQAEIWANCLMPTHVHLIAVPQSGDGLRRAIGECIDDTPEWSISARDGEDTFGRGDSRRSSSMNATS